MGYSSDIFQVWWTSEVHKCVCETCSALCVPKITEIIRFLTKLHVFQKTCFGHSFSRKDYNSLKILKSFLNATQPFHSLLSGTTRVGRYQKKHSPTHTHPDHQTSFINFLYLQRSMAFSLFSLRD